MFENFAKLLQSNTLLTLDRYIMPRLMSLTYLVGLAALAILGLNHLFFSFSLGFGAGLWGIVEIAIFGLLAFSALRLTLELAKAIFVANNVAVPTSTQTQAAPSLIEEVRGAIQDLADEDEVTEQPLSAAAPSKSAATKSATPKPAAKTTRKAPAKRTTRTTAKRSTVKKATAAKSTDKPAE